MSLIAFGWTGLVQSSELVLMILVMIAYAGIFPFFLGIAIQGIFRKKTIPPYVAWALAFAVVAAQWCFTGRSSVRVLEQGTISLIVSFIMIGASISLGLTACRAIMQERKY
jgi:hypothetical protein